MGLNNKEGLSDDLSDRKATVKLMFIVKNTTLSPTKCRNRELFETVKVNG